MNLRIKNAGICEHMVPAYTIPIVFANTQKKVENIPNLAENSEI